MKWFWKLIPHLTFILALMTLTFFCIDRINRSMAFMTSEMSKWTFAGLAVCSILTSWALIACHWREDDREARRGLREQQRQKEMADVLFSNHEAARTAGPPVQGNRTEEETGKAYGNSPHEAD